MDDLTIRKANIGDAPRLGELSGALGYPVETGIIRRRLERILARKEHVVFVAEVSPSLVVGWIHAAEQEILEVGCTCEIWGLVVDKDGRGRGLGRRLVQEAERWAAHRGLDQVSVRSNVLRPESHPFYERIGYSRFKTQHAYRKQMGLHRQP